MHPAWSCPGPWLEWLRDGLLGDGNPSLVSVAAETGFSSSQLSNTLDFSRINARLDSNTYPVPFNFTRLVLIIGK